MRNKFFDNIKRPTCQGQEVSLESLLKTLSTTRVPDNGAFARRIVLGRTAAAHSFVSLVLRPRRHLPCTHVFHVFHLSCYIIAVIIMLVVFQKNFCWLSPRYRVLYDGATGSISLDCYL